ncbi:WD repeat and HMG-box DNA-binding protein 1-like [Tropilaelaps mercedesae]|uniref:WD repeat and HMG-box DNA-binding protein 1-like n=1 Tax=Tropilaelaps mercedesae TaxID=418985 RepID=A0A1V9XDS6_9ACAR|nr:WD repeat and HMG-box DNA-binding protein 1-like [Tropilaelaps mercedesae]
MCLCYVVTCGADGELRVWDVKTILEEGPLSITLGSQCNSVVVQDNSLLCAIDGFRVQKLSPLGPSGELLSETEFEPRPFRSFQAEVFHLAAAGSMVVACLANGKAVLMKGLEESSDIILEGHKAAILSGAVADEKSFVATASCDGSVRVWSTENGRCVKKLEDLFTSQDSVESLQEVSRCHRLAFLNGGNKLLVAGERNIKMYETTTFTVEKDIDIDEIIDEEELIYTMSTGGFVIFACETHQWVDRHSSSRAIYNECQLLTSQTNGIRIGVSTNQGLVNVYSFPDMNQIWSHKLDDTITSIVWLPTDQSAPAPVILLNEKGELMCVTNMNSGSSTEEQMDEVAFDADEEILAGSGVDRSRGTGAIRKRKASDADALLDAGGHKRDGLNEDDDDDDGVDLSAIKSSYMPTILGEDGTDGEAGSQQQHVVVRETVRTVHVKAFHQKPFQIGEVPETAEHGDAEEDDDTEDDSSQERRFLTYNHVGFVVCSISAEESSIDVDFHNSADRHPLTLPNKGYTMAALDGHALVLASESEMMVYLLKPEAGEASSWEAEVKHDFIVAVTLGPTYIAMATQNQLLRLFTPGGAQREVLNLPGPLLCMTGASMFSLRAQELQPQDNLMVFYHLGTGLDDRQNINCMRLRVSHSGVTTRGSHAPVGLPRRIKMVWAGYSEEFRPSYMNSKGILFIYSDKTGAWYPVFDGKEKLGHANTCFMVSVGERYNRLLYISCRRWRPKVRPLPVLIREKLQIPLLDVASDKTQLEARYLRLKQLPPDEVESGMAKLALQMFALALKADRLTRAADIIRMECSHRETLQFLMEYMEASNRNNRYDNLLKLVRQYLDEGESELDEADSQPGDEEDSIMDSTDATPTAAQSEFMPSAPILAPKRIVLGSLRASEKSYPKAGDLNPFKKSTTSASKMAKAGHLDDILSQKITKSAPLPVTKATPEATRLVPKQVKLSSSLISKKEDASTRVNEKRSPLQLYMEDIMDELKAESPDGGSETWLRMAAQKYRTLTSEQRTEYLERSRNPSKRARVEMS